MMAPARCVPVLLWVSMSGCSLLTIKSPEIPLTAPELEARLLTRDYAAHFVATLTPLLTDAPGIADDPAVRSRALRLKVSAVSEVTRASTGLSPLPSMLDTWAFSLQLRDFLATGAGSALLGAAQSNVKVGVTRLAADADTVAREVAGKDYPRYAGFVSGFAHDHPLEDMDLARPSVLTAWVSDRHDRSSLQAVGTVSQALGDVSDRMRIYGERVPQIGLWHAELALDSAGVDEATYRAALHDLDSQLERISKLAETAPELAHEAIVQLRGGLHESTERLDGALAQTLRTVRDEREALTADIAAERAILMSTFDTQRAQITADAAQITQKAVDTSWRELHTLVRDALLLIIVLAIIMLGLPFAGGYLVGRHRRKAG